MSDILIHFTRRKEDGNFMFHCNVKDKGAEKICSSVIKGSKIDDKKGGTMIGNLRKHLERKHPEINEVNIKF